MPAPPEDLGLPIASLFSSAAAAVIRIQQGFDRPGGDGAGMYALASMDASVRFGLVATKSRKLLFIPKGSVTNRLQHRLSFHLSAVPAPPPPLFVEEFADRDALPIELASPAFLVEQDEEQEAIDRLTTALGLGRWRAAMDDPANLKQKALDDEIARIRNSVNSPADSNPQLGVVAFRVAADPPSWLIVHLTEQSDNDGVFLLPSGDSPTVEVFSVSGDKNDRIRYLPMHLMTLAVRRWMSGGEPRRSHLPMGLPGRWGIGTLDAFARAMFDGYRQCSDVLSSQPANLAFPACFHLSSVAAEIDMSVSFAKGEPHFSIVDDSGGLELIHGRAGIAVERTGSAARLVLTLLAPGFVLTAAARDAFMGLARQSAGDIAREFDENHRSAYLEALQRPAAVNGVVVFVTAEKADGKFRLLASWPGALAGEHRDFAFACKRDGDLLSDFHAVIGMEDDMDTAVIDAPRSGGGGLSEDQYEQFSRFFRAVRVWRAGFSA